jgi:ADP-L-glycero-D-manno-heptose 6-epimerase
VTGGAGFIGSALVWRLNQLGCERIVVCDRLGTDLKWRNLVPLRFLDYLEADDLFARLERKAFGKFDLILHLGACSATTERDATFLVHNNYEFTRDLACYALKQGSRFVYASSAATYGNGDAGMKDTAPIDALRPLNMYGYSKQLFDLHAQRAGMLDRIVGLKYFNVFGPNEDHKADMRSVVHKSFAQVRDTGVIRLFKSYRNDYRDGEQKRDFLYVKDAVDMTLHLAASPTAGGLYNIGSSHARTWNELAAAVFSALGKPARIDYVDMPETIRDKYQYFTQADLTRLKGAGYKKAAASLENAVADYVRNYLVPDKRLGDEIGARSRELPELGRVL